ncbi:MAG: tetratricopeptide repeat protein [Myxococcota bacterium]
MAPSGSTIASLPQSMGGSRRYVVIDEIGRGGMGRVVRAYDSKLQREVALKEVRRDMLDEDAAVRLVGEARAMAKLSHPNVVAVHDVEMRERGDVVLVMELVVGSTLRAWLRSGHRPWREVITRFVLAGRGLSAAHEVGLLHRDFKPSNVLLGPDGVVKVTDFGLAKVTGDPVSSASGGSLDTNGDPRMTATGVVLGTPRYMAPEQHRGEVLTAAVDQYSFCVALWEALCGRPPFLDLEHEAQKLAGPPPWPPGETPSVIAQAIVRGLQPDPAARWPSMHALLDALAHDPAVRRRRWLWGVFGLGLAALGSRFWSTTEHCTGGSLRLGEAWSETRRAEVEASFAGVEVSYAGQAWNQAAGQLDQYADEWKAMYRGTCEATAIRAEQSVEVMDLRMACLDRARVQLDATTRVLAEADTQVVQRAHELVADLHRLSRCADVTALWADGEPPAPDQAPAVEEVRTVIAQAAVERGAGHYAAARSRIDDVRQRALELAYGPVHAEVLLESAAILTAQGDYDGAEIDLRQALEIASIHRQWHAMVTAASELMTLVGTRKEQVEDGLRYRELAWGLAVGDPWREAEVHHALGGVAGIEGKYDEAESEYRAALEQFEALLGPDDLVVATARYDLANAIRTQGRHAEAELELRRVLELRTTLLGPEHPEVADAHDGLAGALLAQGKLDQAEVESRRALRLNEQNLGPNHPGIAITLNNLGGILYARRDLAQAEIQLRRVLKLREQNFGPDSLSVASTRSNLALVLDEQGKHQEALAEHRWALARRLEEYEPDHPDIATSRHNLVNTLRALGKLAEAEVEIRLALDSMKKTLSPDHPQVALAQCNLAEVLIDRGQATQALEWAEPAWRDLQSRDDLSPSLRASAAFTLARALGAARDDEPSQSRARSLAQQALEIYEEAGDTDAVDELRIWLAEHQR